MTIFGFKGLKEHTKVEDDFPSPDPQHRKLRMRQGYNEEHKKYYVSITDVNNDITFKVYMPEEFYTLWNNLGLSTINFTNSS